MQLPKKKQLTDAPGQSVFNDVILARKLEGVVRAKTACLVELADDEMEMRRDMLSLATAPSSHLITCTTIEQAYLYAKTVLPPGLGFASDISCASLPPVALIRGDSQAVIRCVCVMSI